MSSTASPELGATRWLSAPCRRAENGMGSDAAPALSAAAVAAELAPTLARIDAGVPARLAQFGPSGPATTQRPSASRAAAPTAPASVRRPLSSGQAAATLQPTATSTASHARRAQEEHPRKRRVGPGAEPVDQGQRPARVGGPVDRPPGAMSEPAAQDAGQRHREQQVEGQRRRGPARAGRYGEANGITASLRPIGREAVGDRRQHVDAPRPRRPAATPFGEARRPRSAAALRLPAAEVDDAHHDARGQAAAGRRARPRGSHTSRRSGALATRRLTREPPPATRRRGPLVHPGRHQAARQPERGEPAGSRLATDDRRGAGDVGVHARAGRHAHRPPDLGRGVARCAGPRCGGASAVGAWTSGAPSCSRSPGPR